MASDHQETVKGALPPIILSVGAVAWKLVAWWSNLDFILSIRDERFLTLFTFLLTFGWWIALIIGVVWLLFVSRAPDNARGKFSWPGLVVVVGVLALIWGVLVGTYYSGAIPNIIVGWGTTGPTCGATLDTSRLLGFSKKYDLALVCGVVDPTRDRFADTRITISSLFTIHPGAVAIVAPHSKDMADAIKSMTDEAVKNAQTSGITFPPGPVGVPTLTWYEAVLIPKGTDVSRLHRLSDVVTDGGKILRQGYFE